MEGGVCGVMGINVWQTILVKENSKFRPVKLLSKIDLKSHPTQGDGLGIYIYIYICI